MINPTRLSPVSTLLRTSANVGYADAEWCRAIIDPPSRETNFAQATVGSPILNTSPSG
jgi:hypothetical protein